MGANSLMIGLAGVDLKGAIDLLKRHDACELVRQGYPAEAQFGIGALLNLIAEAEASSYQKCQR